jgi:hypothetical protein
MSLIGSYSGFASVVMVAVGLLACANGTQPTDTRGGFGGENAGVDASSGATQGFTAATSSPSSSSSSSTGGNWIGGTWSNTECSVATQYIYLLTSTGLGGPNVIYSYWPPTGEYSKVGETWCNGNWYFGNSMAIDRHAIAWLGDDAGGLSKIDLSNGNCTATSYSPAAPFNLFGMAFTRDAAAPTGERLFLSQEILPDPTKADPPTRALGTVDTTSLSASLVSNVSMGNTDLSGTGDGRLYAFEKQTGNWANLVELDPTSGAVLSKTLLAGIQIGSDWAVAAWGGDIYLFNGGVVADYHPSTQLVTYPPGPATQFVVFGAGVSSCAPTIQPN